MKPPVAAWKTFVNKMHKCAKYHNNDLACSHVIIWTHKYEKKSKSDLQQQYKHVMQSHIQLYISVGLQQRQRLIAVSYTRRSLIFAGGCLLLSSIMNCSTVWNRANRFLSMIQLQNVLKSSSRTIAQCSIRTL